MCPSIVRTRHHLREGSNVKDKNVDTKDFSEDFNEDKVDGLTDRCLALARLKVPIADGWLRFRRAG